MCRLRWRLCCSSMRGSTSVEQRLANQGGWTKRRSEGRREQACATFLRDFRSGETSQQTVPSGVCSINGFASHVPSSICYQSNGNKPHILKFELRKSNGTYSSSRSHTLAMPNGGADHFVNLALGALSYVVTTKKEKEEDAIRLKKIEERESNERVDRHKAEEKAKRERKERAYNDWKAKNRERLEKQEAKRSEEYDILRRCDERDKEAKRQEEETLRRWKQRFEERRRR